MRTLTSFTNGNKTTKVRKDSETQEFVVELHIDGKKFEAATYFCDDKADAIATAQAMIEVKVEQVEELETITVGQIAQLKADAYSLKGTGKDEDNKSFPIGLGCFKAERIVSEVEYYFAQGMRPKLTLSVEYWSDTTNTVKTYKVIKG